jgi:Calcineurin-like phosphoesterase
MSSPLAQPVTHPTFGEPSFNEGIVTKDPTEFEVYHANDDAIYKQIEDLLTKKVVGFEKSRLPDDGLYSLADAYGEHGAKVLEAIQKTGQIVFHAVGDTGATSKGAYQNELRVADHATADLRAAPFEDRPAFFYHLGDVVYDFGESNYYYDQFYEPFRNYPAPIFAIPGNHDSFIIPGTKAEDAPLVTFSRNFCATSPQITKEAASLHRTAMTQPGVYFTLDAPFVRIIGLFSNALEDPGVLSSQKGHYKNVPDYQLDFLRAQLERIKKDKYAGAVVLALHHPPFTYSPPKGASTQVGSHSGSPAMLYDIDTICKETGVYPHAVLSGHQHNYQRYTRSLHFGGQDIDVPFIVCGSGGHHINAMVQGLHGVPAQRPRYGTSVKYLDSGKVVTSRDLILENYDDTRTHYGYLRVTVTAARLQIAFQLTEEAVEQAQADAVTVDLATRRLVAS